MRIHSRPPGTTGTQGCQPPSRSHCVRLRPHLGCAFAEGWVPSSRAPDPTGSPSSAASQESGAQAGVPGWLPLCSFSPHLGKAFPPSRGLRVRFPPRWKVPPRGPQRRAHHGNSTGRPPDTGASGHWQTFPGPGPPPCQLGREGAEGVAVGLSPSRAQNTVHSLRAKQRAAECEHVSVCVCAFGRVCLWTDPAIAAPAVCPLSLFEPHSPWLCPS